MMTEPHVPGVDGRPTGRSAKTKLTEIVVVCSKCAKRQGLRGRDLRALLKKAGKQAVQDGGAGRRRKLCVVESGRVFLLDPTAGPAEARAAVLDPVLPRRAIPEFGPNTALAAIPSDESPPVR